MTAAVLAALLDALKYLWVGRSLHVEKSGRALLQPAQAVIDENISPRNLRLEFDHRRPAGRDQCGLHIAEGFGGTFRMDLVENLADYVKARYGVGSGIPEKDPHSLADLGFQRALFAKRPGAPIKNHEIGCLVHHFVDRGLVDAALDSISLEIDIAFHNVEFPVHLRPASRRLDDHETVHSVRKVIGNHRRRAVINKDAGPHRLELEDARGSGRGLSHLAAAAGSEHPMRIDAMAHRTV